MTIRHLVTISRDHQTSVLCLLNHQTALWSLNHLYICCSLMAKSCPGMEYNLWVQSAKDPEVWLACRTAIKSVTCCIFELHFHGSPKKSKVYCFYANLREDISFEKKNTMQRIPASTWSKWRLWVKWQVDNMCIVSVSPCTCANRLSSTLFTSYYKTF